MTFSTALAFAVQVLTVVAPRTPTKIDDEGLEFLKIVANTPDLVAWVEKLLASFGDDGTPPPEGALAMMHVPEAIQGPLSSIGGLVSLAKYLPMLLEIYRAWKAAQKATQGN